MLFIKVSLRHLVLVWRAESARTEAAFELYILLLLGDETEVSVQLWRVYMFGEEGGVRPTEILRFNSPRSSFRQGIHQYCLKIAYSYCFSLLLKFVKIKKNMHISLWIDRCWVRKKLSAKTNTAGSLQWILDNNGSRSDSWSSYAAILNPELPACDKPAEINRTQIECNRVNSKKTE